MQNSVPINTNKLKIRNESKRSLQLGESEFVFFSSQAEKNSRLGKLVSDSSMPPYRSLKANSEEDGIIKVNSLLIARLVFI